MYSVLCRCPEYHEKLGFCSGVPAYYYCTSHTPTLSAALARRLIGGDSSF
jgi:hypothetical protein